MWEVMREVLFGSEGYSLAIFGLGLPAIGSILGGIGKGIGLIKGEKRADQASEIDRMLADLRKREFEEGSGIRKAAREHLMGPTPEREDLSGLYATNPFVGGRKPLGAAGVEASRALGFETAAAPLSAGPVAEPPPASPGPGRGEIVPDIRIPKESIRGPVPTREEDRSPAAREARNAVKRKRIRSQPIIEEGFRPRDPETGRRTFFEAV
jgi:hypothetical protein